MIRMSKDFRIFLNFGNCNLMKFKSFFVLLLVFNLNAFSQTNQQKALDLGKQGIKIMDEGKLDESIDLLRQAQTLDPQKFDYPYEIAYAYYKKEDYRQTVQILEALADHKDVSDHLFQLLGNSYDLLEQPDKALEKYRQGLEKFPQSGKMYLESGVVEYSRKDYQKAIDFWDKGGRVEPHFASIYYKLANLFDMTEERVWTLMYAEIFMNLEPGSKRTEEMSRLLYKNYQETYEVKSDTSGEYKLTKLGVVVDAAKKKQWKNFKKGVFPFEGTYAMTYTMSSIDSPKFDGIKRFYEIRTKFLTYWFDEKKFDKYYPNKLLTFQKEILDKGMFEAYSYWLLSEGNPKEFDEWHNQNIRKYNDFTDWFKKKSLEFRKKDQYMRSHYQE